MLAQRYLSSINWLGPRETEGKRLDLSRLTIQCEDIGKNIHHFVYDGDVIRRKNRFIISYNCLHCSRENVLALNNVISKIERNISQCSTCRGLISPPQSVTTCDTPISTTALQTKIKEDATAFETMDQGFKERYFDRYVRAEAFENMRRSIIGYQYDKFKNIDDIVYVPYFRPTPNTKFFQPMFYDKVRDTIETPKFVTLECCFCAYEFIAKDIAPFRNKARILCKMCAEEFGPTKPRLEGGIPYRTKFQHKFVKYCIKHGIRCEEGPNNVMFTHTRSHIVNATRIHYLLPDVKVLVDVVGNLEFQTKLCARTQALHDFVKEHGLTYVVLYPKNYVKYTRSWKMGIVKTI